MSRQTRAVARRIHFDATSTGVLWFLAAAALFAIGMYGVAEVLAGRVPRQEEYIARVPAIAILPWFLAGSLFPITAMPSGLAWVAKFLPLTHGLALGATACGRTQPASTTSGG